MKLLLLGIPFFTTLLGMFVYKLQGKKYEIFRLDIVQFVYLFIIAPTLYVWMKSFLFYILRNELEIALSVTEIFIIDTVFSVLAFITVSAIAIHSLTKTFWLKRHHDPEFDLYHLSEYFHLWWSHIVIWGGGIVLATFLSFANVFVPFAIESYQKWQFYGVLVLGLVSGIFLFLGIWISDAKQGNYMRLMKLILALALCIHVIIYFILDPKFTMNYITYWFVFAMLISSTVSASTFERYEKTSKLREFFLHVGWGDNKGVDIFWKK